MNESIIDFVYREDVFDFMVRHSQYIENFADNKDVIVAQTLAGRYNICYTEDKNINGVKSSRYKCYKFSADTSWNR